MAKIVYRQMPTPRELPQQIHPGQKPGYKSPRMGENFWCKSMGGARGWLWMKLMPALVSQPASQLTDFAPISSCIPLLDTAHVAMCRSSNYPE